MSKHEARMRRAFQLIAERLGDKVICPRCGATLETWPDVCSATLADPCPGFVAYDEARTAAMKDVGIR